MFLLIAEMYLLTELLSLLHFWNKKYNLEYRWFGDFYYPDFRSGEYLQLSANQQEELIVTIIENASSNGFCGQDLAPANEVEMSKLCNQLSW